VHRVPHVSALPTAALPTAALPTAALPAAALPAVGPGRRSDGIG
jgi:hypothetical protein